MTSTGNYGASNDNRNRYLPKGINDRYDPGGTGCVTGEELLSKLGVRTLEQATNKGKYINK